MARANTLNPFHCGNMPEQAQNTFFVRCYSSGTITKEILRMEGYCRLTSIYIYRYITYNMLDGLEAEPLHVRSAEGAASSTASAYFDQSVNSGTFDIRDRICIRIFSFYRSRQFLTCEYRGEHCGNGNFTLAKMYIIYVQFVHSRLVSQLPCRFTACYHYLLTHHRFFHQFKELYTVVRRADV